MMKNGFALVLFAMLGPTGFVRGAGAGLGLGDFLAQVGKENPAILAASERAGAFEKRAQAVGWWDDPVIAAGPDDVPRNSMAPDQRVTRWQANASVPFPGKLTQQERAATARARGARQGVEALRRSLTIFAAQVYFQWQANQKALTVTSSNLTLLEALAASARASYESGGSSHHAALLAASEASWLKISRIRALRESRTLLARMNVLRGREPGSELAPEIWEPGPGPAPLFPTLEQSLALQPELLAASNAESAAAAEKTLATLALLPDFMVQVMGMEPSDPMMSPTWGLMAGVNVPLFWPWKQGRLAASAGSEARAASLDQASLKLQLTLEWEDAQRGLASSAEAADIYRKSLLPTGRQLLESSRADYVARRGPMEAVISASRSLLQQELEAFEADADLAMAEIRLSNLLAFPPLMKLAPSAPTFGAAMPSGPMQEVPNAGAGMGKGMSGPAGRPQKAGEKSGLGSKNPMGGM